MTVAAENREAIAAVAARGFRDPVFWCQHFFPHMFPLEIPWVHRGLLAVLTNQVEFLLDYGQVDKIIRNFVYVDPQGRERPLFGWEDEVLVMYRRNYLQIMMPRGTSKTSYAGIAVPCRDICYQLVDFSVYVSETGPHAEMQMDNIKRELTSNQRILEVFGSLKPKLKDDERWAAKMFETATGQAFVGRGRGAQVRGLNHKGRRPTKIIVDDLEDKEAVATEVQRQKTREWFFGDLKPALPRIEKNGQIIKLDTLRHREALPTVLAHDEEWSFIHFGAYDKDGELLWPEWMTEKELEKEKASYTLAGQLHIFYLEYFNEARAPELARFKPEWLKYGPLPDPESVVAASLYMDPAISKRETADDCVTGTVQMDKNGTIYVVDIWGKRGSEEREREDEFFRQQKKWQTRFNGIESNAFQASLVHTYRQNMFRRKQYFVIEPITHTSKKSERILGILQGRFAAGHIVLCGRWPKLESQLLDYNPDTDQHDDWPDWLAGAIEQLDPLAAYSGTDDPENEDDIPDLEEEVGGSWLQA